MSSGAILYESTSDGVALLTLNRPDKLNALNGEVLDGLEAAFTSAAADPAVIGILITGAGEKAFAAGADVGEFLGWTPLEAREYSTRGQRTFGMLDSMGKPSIAAINGLALGGGLELALACTLRVASTTAKLGFPEVKLGLIPGYGGTQRLPRMVGAGRALELMLTGEPVDAREAHRLGLVNHVITPEGLLEFCRSLLLRITANAPLAAALITRAVGQGADLPLRQGLELEAALFGLAASSADMREGVSAFLQKRKAGFQAK
jgi:enoyl-CoA hydratase